MERQQVMRRILSATTCRECDEAEKLLHAWMQEHPKDFAMLDAGEQLAMVSGKHEPLHKEEMAAAR